jgi:hypothetical protein
VALVECARTVGFEYVSRSATETTLSILGRTITYETLYVMEFSSERQRMSVIVRCPDGTIKLFCKGADVMMLKRLNTATSPALLSRVNDNLHFFSTKGLRTLIVGTKVIDSGIFERWSERFDQAQGNLTGGTEHVDKVKPISNSASSSLICCDFLRGARDPSSALPGSFGSFGSAGLMIVCTVSAMLHHQLLTSDARAICMTVGTAWLHRSGPATPAQTPAGILSPFWVFIDTTQNVCMRLARALLK